MSKIEEAVGEKNFARLKKAKIHTIKVLRNLSPEEVMSLAGIGPETASKLFTAIGKRPNKRDIRSKYNKLKIRTRFKKIRTSIKKFNEDPKPVIQKLEDKREEVILWRNFLASVHNFGKPEGNRLKQVPYVPIGTQIDPTKLGYQKALRHYLYEFRIKEDKLGFEIIGDRYNLDNNSRDHHTEFKASSGEEVIDFLGNQYSDYRDATPDGYFIVILNAGLYNIDVAIQKAYSRDIDRKIFLIVDSDRDYKEWEIMHKFIENPIFIKMIDSADAFRVFFKYEEYIKTVKDPLIFSDYEKTRDANCNFIEETNAATKSYITLKDGKPLVYFGIVEGIPDMFEYMKNGYSKDDQTYLKTPTIDTWEDFKNFASNQPFYYKEIPIRSDILAFVIFVFKKDHTIWYKDGSSPLIITSDDIPELGVVIK